MVNRSSQYGFTLLEVIVAVALFAIISTVTFSALKITLDSREQTDKQLDRLQELQMTFTLIGRDLRQIVNRPIRDLFGSEKGPLVGGSTLEFTRSGWRNPAQHQRSHLQRVGYGVVEEDLVRLSWWVLDRSESSESVSVAMLHDVQALEVRFLDSQQEWQTQWPVSSSNLGGSPAATPPPALPRAIEVTLELEDWGRITRLFRVAGL